MGTYKNMKNGWITYDKYSTFLVNDIFTEGKKRNMNLVILQFIKYI